MKHNLEITILGCGSSGGVPRVGGDWGACDPQNPKNARLRSSILVSYWQGGKDRPDQRTHVLVDTAPDLRTQLLREQVQQIDGLLYTHDHGDQTHGIDDLRAVAYRQEARIPVWMDAVSGQEILDRFRYCFATPEGRKHPPILDKQEYIKAGDNFTINGSGGALPVRVFEAAHGSVNALGFVFGERIAYLPDAHTLEEDVLESLAGLDVWIVDALRYHKHPTHAHIDKSLQWGAQARARKLVFTNLHIDMDYKTLLTELPGPHEPAYDGMKIAANWT